MTTLILLVSLVMGAPVPTHAPPARTVQIRNFMFEPATLTIRAGDSVTFVNRDDEAHTVTADSKSFDSQGLDTNDSWTHVFRSSGTFHYFCELHPSMKGTILVVAAKKP